jgi:hypothetical protein
LYGYSWNWQKFGQREKGQRTQAAADVFIQFLSQKRKATNGRVFFLSTKIIVHKMPIEFFINFCNTALEVIRKRGQRMKPIAE